MTVRHRPSSLAWRSAMERLAAQHEGAGRLAPADFIREALRLGVSARAVRDRWLDFVRKSAPAWLPSADELAAAARCAHFGCAVRCLRRAGVDAPSPAVERELWRDSSLAVGSLQRRERARRSLSH